MKKKELASIPKPIVKKEYQKLRTMFKDMRGIIQAECREVSGEETLIINCFRPKGKNSVELWFRLFCQKEDYITQDFSDKKVKWRTGAFDYIAGYQITDWCRLEGKWALASPQDEDIIIEFMRKWRKETKSNRCDAGYKFDDYIYAYQADIRDRKLIAKHQKVRGEIDARMDLFPDLPDDYQNFVEHTVFDEHNYIFYSRKQKWAYCTRCGFEYEIRKDGVYHKKIPVWNNKEKLRHNHDFMCPHCGKWIMAKSAGMGRGQLLEINWSTIIQTNGSNVLVRYICHTKDFRKDFRHPEFNSRELFRTIHTPKNVEDYEMGYYKMGRDSDSYVYRWRDPVGHGWGWNPSELQVPRQTVLYNTDFGLLTDTCMKYSCFDIFFEKVVPSIRNSSPWIVDQFFNLYHEYPFVEQVLKLGWYSMAKEMFVDKREIQSKGFTSGRTIAESLGINREQFLVLREATHNNPRIKDVCILKYAAQSGKRLRVCDLEELRYINDNGWSDMYKNYIDAMEYTSIHKLRKYITEQHIKHERDYFDFAGWLIEMGYDMRNEFNIYPRNFVEKHDEMAKVYQKFHDKKHKEDIKKFNRLLKQMRKDVTADNPINLQIQGLFIRLPYQATELKTEGETLHHCVGTYIDRVMKGETTIFFVRQIKKPDKPYYTLEWKDHKVVQCRGLHNCDMTPEVMAFTSLFEEKMKAYELQGKVG